jgi:hypothetical protein
MEEDMKKTVLRMIIILIVLGCSSMAQAYSYGFDVQGGDLSLNADDGADGYLSVVTTSDLMVVSDFDPPPDDALLDYSLSLDMTLGLFGGFVTYDLAMGNVALGVFQGIDPVDWIGDGSSVMLYEDTTTVSGQFGNYTLNNATLDYDIMFTPPPAGTDAYAITIAMLSLSGGNTGDLLSGIVDDLVQSGEVPFDLNFPIVNFPISLGGTAELVANPVPVPAAVWLFGSGLIGLVGVRRRMRR